MSTIAVVGGRDFSDSKLFWTEMRKARKQYKFKSVVSGGAEGADTFAKVWSEQKKVPITVHKPDLSKGKFGPLERNKKIVDDSDFMIAFWDGKSKGTKHSIGLANKKGIPVVVINYSKQLVPPTRVKIQRKDNRVIQGCDEYIGRACSRGGWNLPKSKYANPFKLTDYSREECIKKYEDYARQKFDHCVLELCGKTIGCFCPENEPCHGDVLVRLVKEKLAV